MDTDKTAAQLAAALPLHKDETIVWYRPAASGDGYELRVRTADGFEGMHDVSADQMEETS